MVVLGILIFAIAVAAAIVAVAQNGSTLVDVHGLGYNGQVHLYWVLIAGLVIAGVALLGLAMMRSGASRAARIRSERRGLRRENARLNEIAAERPAARTVPTAQRVPVDGEYDAQPVEATPGTHRPLFRRASHV